MLLNFLNIRVVVDDKNIYMIEKKKLMLISLPADYSKIVVTDGFHYTKPLEIVHNNMYTYYCKIECAIDDAQLIVGTVILSLIYAAGLTSGIFFLKLLSFLPVFYFLFLYYINRKEFLRIQKDY